jgi:hypothetical protein
MSPWRITFLLHALPSMQEEVFFSVASLLNLEVDLLFFDGSSTYWERDSADDGLGGDSEVGVEPAAEDGAAVDLPWGHLRTTAAAHGQGRSAGLEPLPGRLWVLDRGFTLKENRRYLQRRGGHYIMGEKLRGASAWAAAALSRQGR